MAKKSVDIGSLRQYQGDAIMIDPAAAAIERADDRHENPDYSTKSEERIFCEGPPEELCPIKDFGRDEELDNKI